MKCTHCNKIIWPWQGKTKQFNPLSTTHVINGRVAGSFVNVHKSCRFQSYLDIGKLKKSASTRCLFVSGEQTIECEGTAFNRPNQCKDHDQ